MTYFMASSDFHAYVWLNGGKLLECPFDGKLTANDQSDRKIGPHGFVSPCTRHGYETRLDTNVGFV